jgi:ABC-type multidrug transport system fused ATPase/permease subunit
MTGRTTIIISHNLLTVTEADHIIYLHNGRITETGTHTQLLANNRHYAHLYHLHHPSTLASTTTPSVRNGAVT